MLTSRRLSDIFMKEIRLASKIIKTLTKDSIHYPSRLYANLFIIVSRLGVVLALYWYVFKLNGGVVNGVTFVVIAWSMFFYFVFSNFNLRRISRFIMEDVKSGNVEVFLNRPISYLSYKIWWTFGMGFYNFVFIGILGFLVLLLLIGVPESMTISLFIPTLFLELILTSILIKICYLHVFRKLFLQIKIICGIFYVMKTFHAYPCVNFGCFTAFMPQQCLNISQICS